MRETTKRKTHRHSRDQRSMAVAGTAAAVALLGGLILGAEPTSQAAESDFSMTNITEVAEPIVSTQKAAKDDGPQIPVQKKFEFSAGWGNSTGPHAGRSHAGIDLAAPTGTPIVSATDGKVVQAGNNGGYGNLITIRTDDGHEILYAHLSKIGVEKGDKVKAGEQIGRMGSTGHSTGPHLHFEVHNKKGNAINPLKYLDISNKQLVKAGQ